MKQVVLAEGCYSRGQVRGGGGLAAQPCNPYWLHGKGAAWHGLGDAPSVCVRLRRGGNVPAGMRGRKGGTRSSHARGPDTPARGAVALQVTVVALPEGVYGAGNRHTWPLRRIQASLHCMCCPPMLRAHGSARRASSQYCTRQGWARHMQLREGAWEPAASQHSPAASHQWAEGACSQPAPPAAGALWGDCRAGLGLRAGGEGACDCRDGQGM